MDNGPPFQRPKNSPLIWTRQTNKCLIQCLLGGFTLNHNFITCLLQHVFNPYSPMSTIPNTWYTWIQAPKHANKGYKQWFVWLCFHTIFFCEAIL